jgi:hypothetical protein
VAGANSTINVGNGPDTITAGLGGTITGGGPAAPNLTTPTISGTAQEGQTLSAAATSNDPIAYAWYSSADGYTRPIGTGASYLVKKADEGFTIEVKATAANGMGAITSILSLPTAAMLDATPTVTTPVIIGSDQEGRTLTASATARQADNPVTYAWYSSADGYTNAIGTGAIYLVKETDEGFIIEVKATATNDNGMTASAMSASFTAPSGTLKLDASSANNGNSYTGAISGFGAQDQIDLADIGFGNGITTTPNYAPNGENSSGVLTVSDGTHTANLALLGQYMASSFVLSTDGHGGTLITDPPPTAGQQLTAPHS